MGINVARFAAVIGAFLMTSGGSAVSAAQFSAPPDPPPYALSDFAAYARPGDATLGGRAVIPTRAFGSIVFAHHRVTLLPRTPFNIWFVNRFGDVVANNGEALQYPADLVAFNRSAETDANGYFRFDHLPVGAYIVDLSTDYEEDLPRIERSAVSFVDDGDGPTMVSTERVSTVPHRELDVAAAAAVVTHAHRAVTLGAFTVLGSFGCCEQTVSDRDPSPASPWLIEANR